MAEEVQVGRKCHLFLFRAAGEYFGGAAGVLAADWERAAQLLRNYLAAKYTIGREGHEAYNPDGTPRYTRVYGRDEFAPLWGKDLDHDHWRPLNGYLLHQCQPFHEYQERVEFVHCHDG